MLSGARISLDIHSDTILFHGTEESASSKLLYGKVRLHVKSKTRIRSLYANVSGISSYGFVNENYESPSFNVNNCYASKSQILDHKEVLFESYESNGSLFLPKTYEFSFIIKMEGSLPATVYTEYGKTEYKLKVVLEKANILSMNVSKSIPIYVRRIIDIDQLVSPPVAPPQPLIEAVDDLLPAFTSTPTQLSSSSLITSPVSSPISSPSASFADLPSTINHNSSAPAFSPTPSVDSSLPRLISKSFDNKLHLKIYTNSSIYTTEQQLKISVELFPLHESVRVISIGSVFNESVSIKSLSSTTGQVIASKRYLRIINSVHKNLSSFQSVSKNEFFSSNSYEMLLQTSSSHKSAQLDIENSIFKVSHYVKLYCIIDFEGKREKLFSVFPVFIVPNEYFTEFNNLPLYSPSEPNAQINLLPPAYSE
ncbi:hypothetical protein AYI70_g3697 [Smittium culicis]|uniref:Arrestin-like N-terminal domain-containing protein n=1 Tax=Smittium culicis TaxID=133412 RepID=A0A1R1Y2G7_9FUNG|nr:hypothetical protein AYI70_g3697 [Smittium culicis]